MLRRRVFWLDECRYGLRETRAAQRDIRLCKLVAVNPICHAFWACTNTTLYTFHLRSLNATVQSKWSKHSLTRRVWVNTQYLALHFYEQWHSGEKLDSAVERSPRHGVYILARPIRRCQIKKFSKSTCDSLPIRLTWMVVGTWWQKLIEIMIA